MDLIALILVLAIVGFLVYLITTKMPMPPYWATVLQVFALLVVLLYLLPLFGVRLPRLLPP